MTSHLPIYYNTRYKLQCQLEHYVQRLSEAKDSREYNFLSGRLGVIEQQLIQLSN